MPKPAATSSNPNAEVQYGHLRLARKFASTIAPSDRTPLHRRRPIRIPDFHEKGRRVATPASFRLESTRAPLVRRHGFLHAAAAVAPGALLVRRLRSRRGLMGERHLQHLVDPAHRLDLEI